MKKLTKLTALALALALMLGMTAMAGTPSEVLVYDDFSDFKAQDGTLSFSNFDAEKRVKNTTAIKENDSAFFSPTEGIYKYFYNNNMTLVNTNGKITIAENSCIANASPTGGFYYTVPEAWTYAKYGDNSYGLFTQIDWTPVSATAGKYMWGHQGHIGVIIDTANVTNEVNRYLGVNVNADGTLISNKTANQSNGNNGRNNSTGVKVGEESVIRQIVRAATKDSQTNAEDRFDTDTSLNVFSHYGRNPKMYNGNYLHDASRDDITEIKGFYFASTKYVQSTWGEFVMAKISLDRADFYMETEAIAETVATEGSIDIVFSQPISTTAGLYSNVGTDANILERVVVATGEGEDAVTLTYGEDYTIDVDEKIVGTAIKGVMTIKPLKDWAFATTYSVTMPANVMSAMRLSMPEENKKVVTFTTEAAPTFALTLNAYKGLSATGDALTALEAGTTYFAVSATQSSGKAYTNGNVRIEILDGEGNVVKYVSAKKALSTTEAATYGAAFKLEAGQTAKAYVVGTDGVATID